VRRRYAAFISILWLAFVARGAFQAVVAPMWDGFDEPFHVAYVDFVARHGRPPGFLEKSFPAYYYRALWALPSFIGHGAPGFPAWRDLTAAERAARRDSAAILARPGPGGPVYVHNNYERQQPPLFYYVAAPVAWLFRNATLPERVVALRLFGVFLSSLVVPISAWLFRLLLPARGLFFALPIAALLPNTLFFVDHVTNDALAWPVMASFCFAAVLAARRPERTLRFLAVGLLAAAAVWTKLTLLPVLPAALAAVLLARRRHDGRAGWTRKFFAAFGTPVALLVPLFLWNHISSGTWTGIIYEIQTPGVGAAAYLAALPHFHPWDFIWPWVTMHLWSGGWAFVGPRPAVYRLVVAALAALGGALALSAWRRKSGLAGWRRMTPLVVFALFFLLAMFFHALSCVVVGLALHTGPAAGGEGWYFDVLRPIEAALAGSLLCAGIGPRHWRATAASLIGAIVLADLAGTFGDLLPHWAGLAGGLSSAGRPLLPAIGKVFRGAVVASPVGVPPALAAALLGLYLVFCGAATVRCIDSAGQRVEPAT
jgi:hypothetical protein